jgi:RHS repeat-associated protein
MKSAKLAVIFAVILMTSCLLLAQSTPNVENGFKSFGSYHGGELDTVNLQTGNLMFHVPLFSYPQRGGKLDLSNALMGSSKNWQVGEWADSQHINHQKWILAEPAGVPVAQPYFLELHRNRYITTDFAGNQTERDDNYSVVTQDGSLHWLSGSLSNSNMMTMDGSRIQFTLIRGTRWDHSDDSGVIVERDGTRQSFSNISVPMSLTGQGNSLSGAHFPPELVLDAWGTTQTGYDIGTADSRVDANGNAIVGSTSDTLGHSTVFGVAISTSDYSGCVTSRTITSASIYTYPGPDATASNIKVCMTTFLPTAAFSQPNVNPPRTAVPGTGEMESFPQGAGSYLGSLVMPDGSHWSFDYDDFGNVTGITLPTGGTITYQWMEVSSTCADGSLTQVSRAVSSRTVNDLSTSQPWHYTWGTLQQDGSITNYVLDPNGNETAHVFRTVTSLPCTFYEVQTRTYQGAHTNGALLHTVDTHYLAGLGFTASSTFAANVVPDIITTTLPGNRVSKVVRQYDSGSGNMITFGKVTNEKVYDFGSGTPGTLLRETVTTYTWQGNSAYLNVGLLDLPASVVVKDGAGCALAETDYTYDEPNYLTAYTGTLPQGTHVASPGGAVRGNLTTVTKWLAATSSCNPQGGTAVTSHSKWYDTGEPYQTIDPLGHTTALTYDSAYAGAYATQTCSPQTGTVTHCVSGTYDFVTGLLETLTNENATTQASGNTSGDSGHTSNFVYDTSWRLTSAQAPPDPANVNARATTTFTPSAPNAFPLNFLRQKSVTNALTDSSSVYVDGLARVNKTTHTLPNGTATVLTTYDGVGQPVSVTNPYFTTADPTYGVTASLYDALGRVTQATRQDGSISTVSYGLQSALATSADCTRTTDEAGKQRKACADALGRLIEVDEANPGSAAVPANGTLTINGTLQSHTSSGSAAVAAHVAVTVMSADGSGNDSHVDDPSEPCPPLPQTCQQIYDTGWIRITVNGIAAQVAYGQFDTDTSLASALAAAIGGNPYVIASVNGSTINIQARTAGAAGNSITVSTASATNDPGDFGGAGFGFNLISSNLSGGADAVNPVTTWDQGTLTLTIGSFTASVPYAQSGNNTAAQIATALIGTGSTGLNRSGSPVSATASGAGITLTYRTAGAAGNGVVIGGSSQSTQTQWTFSPPSFTSPGATLANGLNAGDVSNNPLVTLYQYDALGNLLCVEQHGNVSGTGCSAAPSNDATSPWRVRRFTYDSLSRLLTATNPESGTITYAYDADSELLQKTSPAANQTGSATQIVSYCYDALHRVTGKGYGAQSCPLATPVVSYAYDSGTNAKGHLTSLTDQAGTATYAYDILGRLTTETRSLKGANNAAISKSLSYSYNLDGSVKSLTYPSGKVITYTPDSAGRTLSAIDSGSGINYVTGATYGPDSGLTGFVSGNSGTFAGITNSFSYNKRLQPVNMSATAPSQTVFSIGYDFHVGNGTTGTDNGNVWGITNYKDTTRNQTFTYDALNRLISAQNAGTDCTATVLGGNKKFWGNNYGYDAWGNLLSKSVTKCSAENLSVVAGNNNRLTGAYLYDAPGNMTHDATSGLNYTFDQENRLTGAAGYTYTYDGDGARVRKSNGNLAANGTLYWDMTPGVVAETDLAGTTKSEYIFFDGERVARRDGPTGTGGVFYYFSDHLKTASVITDSAGVIKAESDYYPWGGELQFVNNDSNDYKFTGKKRDIETGLDYFGARYYSNGLGRWVSADWSAKPVPVPYADFGDPQSLNLYAYVGGNPASKADPDGHQGPGDVLQVIEVVTRFANNPGGFIKSFFNGAGKQEVANINMRKFGQPDLKPNFSNDVERAGGAALNGANTATSYAAVFIGAKKGGDVAVEPYEAGTYGELSARSKGDGLSIDHIPSNASNLARATVAKGEALTPAEANAVRAQGMAVAAPDAAHRSASPTYGGRNTPAQIQADAANPQAAAARDTQAMVNGASATNNAAAKAAAAKINKAADNQ